MWNLRKLVSAAMVAVVTFAAPFVTGHGQLSEPAARNVVHNSNWCSWCLAASGPGETYAGGRVWPNSLHGVCGDPFKGPRDHEAGGKFATKVITGRYVQGQTIPIKIKITAPHGGRFSFGVCPLPDGVTDAQERKIATQKCFDSNPLTNAEDGTRWWWFGKRGAGDYMMKFKLPGNVKCSRCVLQWHYETGNSCNIPGTPPQHILSPNMVSCDKVGVMEEFWNCADVSIAGGAPPKNSTAVPVIPKKASAKNPTKKPAKTPTKKPDASKTKTPTHVHAPTPTPTPSVSITLGGLVGNLFAGSEGFAEIEQPTDPAPAVALTVLAAPALIPALTGAHVSTGIATLLVMAALAFFVAVRPKP